MRVIRGFTQSPARRWAILGLLTAAVLAVALVANAKRSPKLGSFQQVESGINHAQMVCDGHHMCGVGVNDMLGHFVATVAMVDANSGVVEYQFPGPGGDSIYGTLNTIPTKTPGVSLVNVRFTKGTGRFENRVNGTASGTLRYGEAALGAKPYTASVQGTLYYPPE